MRIAIFTNNYLPNVFGVTRSVESFKHEFEKNGHEVHVFAPKWSNYEDLEKNVSRYPSIEFNYKIKFPLPIPFSFEMDNKIKEIDFDVIHSQHPNLLGYAAMRWAKKKNIPLIFTWHTLYDQYTHYVPKFIPRKLADWWVIRNAVKYANKADAIVIPTASIKKIIKNWGVTNPEIAPISSGIECEPLLNYDRETVREQLKIQKDDIVLNITTRLSEEKNLVFLFETIFGILKRNENVKFLVVGGGSLFGELERMVSGAGLEGKVILTGLVDKPVFRSYMQASDIFVYSSKSETQGIIVAEAMYMGLPVVAVKATGIKDVVLDKATGFLVDDDQEKFTEAVERLIYDKELRSKFAENGKKIASDNYTSEVCADKMLQFYTRIIEKKKSQS